MCCLKADPLFGTAFLGICFEVSKLTLLFFQGFEEYNDELMEKLISILEQGARDGELVTQLLNNSII